MHPFLNYILVIICNDQQECILISILKKNNEIYRHQIFTYESIQTQLNMKSLIVKQV